MNKCVDDKSVVETIKLKLENEILSSQIKSLTKAESKLYEYQEELDAQLKEYKDLYELSRKINLVLDIKKIFEYAVGYVIRNLEYERVVFLQQFEDTGNYVVCALEGFYDPQERNAVAELTVAQGDPLLSPLWAREEYLICKADSAQQDLVEYRARLLMHEYLIYPLGSHERPLALLAVGNSAENAGFYRQVSDREGALLGMGNLVGLLSSSVENYISYSSMEKALEKKRQAEAKYRGIFENAAEGIFQTTGAGRFLSCNPAAAAILGYVDPDELIESVNGLGRRLYVHPQRRSELFKLLRQGGAVKNFEVEFYRKDGSTQWVLLSIRAVFNAEGKVLYVDGILQDIAERKRAEKSIRELNEELERRVIARTSELEKANLELRQVTWELESAYGELKSAQSRILQQEKMASVGQLAAGVAHEINNPMGFIISNLNSLRKYAEKITIFMDLQSDAIEALSTNPDADKIAENLKHQNKALKLDYVLADLEAIIQESLDGAERVKKIVQDLKGFSRLNESTNTTSNVNDGIESTINIVWNEIKYKAVLKKEYGDIPQIECNLGHLNQVFMNLLVNAAQAIETQGEITVKTFSDNENIYITIADTGAGIPADKLNRIFEPFYTTKEVGKGTGLGLSIAYDIVKKHNGEIRVESEIGKGTTFTIAIPM